MRFLVLEPEGRLLGPWGAVELRRRLGDAAPSSGHRVFDANSGNEVPAEELRELLTASERSPATSLWGWLWPFSQLPHRRMQDNRRLGIATVAGLAPLLLIPILTQWDDTARIAYWGIALYVSGLWAMFFYDVFPAPRIQISLAIFCFFLTGITSLGALRLLYLVPGMADLFQWLNSENAYQDLVANVFAVGVPEELTKALALFLIPKPRGASAPLTYTFYGIMSGLGFGIYEGVHYQVDINDRFADTGQELYLYNLLRLTSLPFIHAIWSGIVGYFVGLSFELPKYQLGLAFGGIGVAALLHGLYNHYGNTVASFGFALLSVIMLNLYVARFPSVVVRSE